MLACMSVLRLKPLVKGTLCVASTLSMAAKNNKDPAWDCAHRRGCEDIYSGALGQDRYGAEGRARLQNRFWASCWVPQSFKEHIQTGWHLLGLYCMQRLPATSAHSAIMNRLGSPILLWPSCCIHLLLNARLYRPDPRAPPETATAVGSQRIASSQWRCHCMPR